MMIGQRVRVIHLMKISFISVMKSKYFPKGLHHICILVQRKYCGVNINIPEVNVKRYLEGM